VTTVLQPRRASDTSVAQAHRGGECSGRGSTAPGRCSTGASAEEAVAEVDRKSAAGYDVVKI
jgi:hypothetical protein